MRFAVRYDKKHNSLETIGAWASGEPDELLDEWYDKYGNQNPNGDAREILREGLNTGEYHDRIKIERTPVNHPVTEQSIEAVPQVNAFDDEEMNKRWKF